MEKGMIKKDNLKKFGVYNIVLLLFFLSDGIFYFCYKYVSKVNGIGFFNG